MIICQIITTLVYGGAEKLLVNFSNILADDHEIHIIYLKGNPRLKSSFDSRITIHHVPLGLFCARDIRKLVKKLKPDVVHTHLGHADLIGQWACRGLSVKLFCTMHNVYFKWNWLDNVFFFLYRLSFRNHARHCIVSCISTAVARHTQETLGVKPDHIRIHHNAVPDLIAPLSKVAARIELGVQPADFIILTIGRLRVQKSIDTLLRALPEIKDRIKSLRVLIVGEGELEHELKQLSTELHLGQTVTFTGGTQTPETYFAAADIFVLPSVFEGLPTVVLEAFRSSLAVVASNIDGTNELIKHEENGFLFPSTNSAALAAALIQVYESDELRQRLAHNGNLSYRNHYDIRGYAKKMEILYTS